MKKFIAIVIAAVMCMSLFGCASTSTGSEPTEATKPNTPVEVDISQFPDAEEFDVYEWPSLGAATTIPMPMWSNRGHIYYDSEKQFQCEVGYSTVEDFNDYVKACQEAGYTVNYFSVPDELYYAENSEGQAVMIGYSDYFYYVEIWTAFDTSEWFKWWEN